MKSDVYKKFFKAGIVTTLVASAVVVAPTSEVNAQKESGKEDNKNNGKNNEKGKNQTPIVDKTKLQTTITNVSNVKKEDYTVDSWNKFQQALSSAQKVVKDSKATQSDVTKALNNLTAAIDNLAVKKQPTEEQNYPKYI